MGHLLLQANKAVPDREHIAKEKGVYKQLQMSISSL